MWKWRRDSGFLAARTAAPMAVTGLTPAAACRASTAFLLLSSSFSCVWEGRQQWQRRLGHDSDGLKARTALPFLLSLFLSSLRFPFFPFAQLVCLSPLRAMNPFKRVERFHNCSRISPLVRLCDVDNNTSGSSQFFFINFF